MNYTEQGAFSGLGTSPINGEIRQVEISATVYYKVLELEENQTSPDAELEAIEQFEVYIDGELYHDQGNEHLLDATCALYGLNKDEVLKEIESDVLFSY